MRKGTLLFMLMGVVWMSSCEKDQETPKSNVSIYDTIETTSTSASISGVVFFGTKVSHAYLQVNSEASFENGKTIEIKVVNDSIWGEVEDLKPQTMYYYRYLLRGDWGDYTDEKTRSFVTKDSVAPRVETSDVFCSSSSTAICKGRIVADGWGIIERGFCYSATNTPTIEDSHVAAIADKDSTFICMLDKLPSNTSYYVRAYAKNGVGVGYGETKKISTANVVDGHDYVDLGLSVKWATCNIGAKSAMEYGDYFAWGEIKAKNYYTSATYSQTKYNSSDGKTVLESDDDAAVQIWGGKWRMPTPTEQKELIQYAKWTFITKDGVKGYKVSNKADTTKYIFLPLAGKMADDGLDGEGLLGQYWSNSLCDIILIWYEIEIIKPSTTTAARYKGCSIRPICEN